MKATTIVDGISNWERLKAFSDAAIASSPALARKDARFGEALRRRQNSRMLRVLAAPDTKEYADYIIPSLKQTALASRRGCRHTHSLDNRF